jgi:hypothetical protein
MRIEQLKEQRKSVSTELLKLMELKQMELRMQISRIDLDMAKSGYESETDVQRVKDSNGEVRVQWTRQRNQCRLIHQYWQLLETI